MFAFHYLYNILPRNNLNTIMIPSIFKIIHCGKYIDCCLQASNITNCMYKI